MRLDGRRGVRLPKLGWVRMAERLRWGRGRVKTVRVTTEAGRWYISLGVDWPRERRPAAGASAGLDVGVKTLAVLASADGAVERRYANPRALAAFLRRLRRAGRAVSRKRRGSANRARAVGRLARVHARVTAVRRDAAEKASTDVARRVRMVGLENLSVRGMLRARPLARAVADASMSALLGRVRVKVLEAGGSVTVAPRWYASTRTCSACRSRTGRVPRGLAGLSVRRWACERCGAVHDRDVNAARNLDPARWPVPDDAASCAES